MPEIYLVYITAAKKSEAIELAEKLVENKLAACVNIYHDICSVYRWEGKVQKDREVAMLAKTTGQVLPRLIKYIKKQHSYQCPCIAAMAVDDGNRDFLQWIEEQVAMPKVQSAANGDESGFEGVRNERS